MYKFIFDLDGTLTTKETLPMIAEHFGIKREIKSLTNDTISGNIPFVESFIKRVHILGNLNVSQVNALLEAVPIYPKIQAFIQNNRKQCIIATGNIYYWIESLVKKFGVKVCCSKAEIRNNKIERLTEILCKENIVKKEQNLGYKVVFIGDGNNDLEAMRFAGISIACGLTHYPAVSIQSIADYAVFSEEALCRQLNQLL
jgi:HAD superfamily phosphoserine phosphatase-like hydrolase